MPIGKDDVQFRPPRPEDGLEIHSLIADSPPLDLNSVYSYCLFGAHFDDSCILAEQAGTITGFISAYRIPRQPDTLFVWQVVVSKEARGQGMARRMLDALLQRFDDSEIGFVEATVNPSNSASRGIFAGLARNRGTTLQEKDFLAASAFGDASGHEPEILLRVPLQP